MQFYKYEGFAVDAKWSEENDNRRVMRERVRKISMKTNDFNQHLRRTAYIFVVDASEDTVTIGVIVRKTGDLLKLISDYLQTMEVQLKDTCLEEVTFKNFSNMLSCADRADYIDDDVKVLEMFDLYKLSWRSGRSVEYGENILDVCTKQFVYDEATRYLARDTLIPELDRIYVGSHSKQVGGHPVHYMIQTDDSETRNGMYKLLLQALYANNRLCSKRYSFLDFRPGEYFSNTVYECLYKSCIK